MTDNEWKLSKKMVRHGFNYRFGEIMIDIDSAYKEYFGIESDILIPQFDNLLFDYLIDNYDFDNISKTAVINHAIVEASLTTEIWFERSRTELYLNLGIRRDSKAWDSRYLIYIKGCADEEECKVFGGQLRDDKRIVYYITELEIICKAVQYMYLIDNNKVKIQNLFENVYNQLSTDSDAYTASNDSMSINVVNRRNMDGELLYDIIFTDCDKSYTFYKVPIAHITKED